MVSMGQLFVKPVSFASVAEHGADRREILLACLFSLTTTSKKASLIPCMASQRASLVFWAIFTMASNMVPVQSGQKCAKWARSMES